MNEQDRNLNAAIQGGEAEFEESAPPCVCCNGTGKIHSAINDSSWSQCDACGGTGADEFKCTTCGEAMANDSDPHTDCGRTDCPMLPETDRRNLLVLEIMALAYAVDRHTEHAVFIDYHGHVENLSIEIAESKERYHNKLASTEFYVSGKFQKDPNLAWLQAKRAHLKHILDTHEIDFGAMREVSERVFSYAF